MNDKEFIELFDKIKEVTHAQPVNYEEKVAEASQEIIEVEDIQKKALFTSLLAHRIGLRNDKGWKPTFRNVDSLNKIVEELSNQDELDMTKTLYN